MNVHHGVFVRSAELGRYETKIPREKDEFRRVFARERVDELVCRHPIRIRLFRRVNQHGDPAFARPSRAAAIRRVGHHDGDPSIDSSVLASRVNRAHVRSTSADEHGQVCRVFLRRGRADDGRGASTRRANGATTMGEPPRVMPMQSVRISGRIGRRRGVRGRGARGERVCRHTVRDEPVGRLFASSSSSLASSVSEVRVRERRGTQVALY